MIAELGGNGDEAMTVGELKKQLDGVNDDMDVMITREMATRFYTSEVTELDLDSI